MPYKGKAVVDGKEIDVELVAAPEGLISQEQFDVRFRDELARRTDSIKGSLPDDLLKDEKFRDRALKTWNVTQQEKGKAKLDDDAVKGMQDAWTKEHVEPLSRRLTEREKEIEEMRGGQLTSEMLQVAARLGVKPRYLEPAAPGAEPWIVAATRNVFGFDGKSKGWAVRDGEGFAFSANATASKPYKTVEEYLKEWAGRKENAEFLNVTTQRGTNFGDAGGGGRSGGVVQISRSDARYADKWRIAEAEAKKINGTVEIVDG